MVQVLRLHLVVQSLDGEAACPVIQGLEDLGRLRRVIPARSAIVDGH